MWSNKERKKRSLLADRISQVKQGPQMTKSTPGSMDIKKFSRLSLGRIRSTKTLDAQNMVDERHYRLDRIYEDALKGTPKDAPPLPTGVVATRIDPETGAKARASQTNAMREFFLLENPPKTRHQRQSFLQRTAKNTNTPTIILKIRERDYSDL